MFNLRNSERKGVKNSMIFVTSVLWVEEHEIKNKQVQVKTMHPLNMRLMIRT